MKKVSKASIKREMEHELYGCSRAKYKARIRAVIRQLWQWSKPRKEAFRRARKKYNGSTVEVCEMCGETYEPNEKEFMVRKDGNLSKKKVACLVCHHKEQIPDVFEPDFMVKMFCEQFENPSDGYMILCNDCHYKVHNEEKKEESDNEEEL